MRRRTLIPILLSVLVTTLVQAQSGYPRTRRNGTRSDVTTTGSYKDLAGTFHGTLKQLSSKEIVLQNDDDQTVVIRRSRKTKFLMDHKDIKASALALNTLVTVEAVEDIDLKPIALSVSVDIPKPETNP